MTERLTMAQVKDTFHRGKVKRKLDKKSPLTQTYAYINVGEGYETDVKLEGTCIVIKCCSKTNLRKKKLNAKGKKEI